ncbi:hypothetical protein [Parasitella parasitica]|uniref:Uncharacterized protein n=1 Tax=Parasitella parasitica TaxID=35722 RepID=A0A0B7NNU0_9FUNG|nr:hypothetical protein [Parasitella parasitica]
MNRPNNHTENYTSDSGSEIIISTDLHPEQSRRQDDAKRHIVYFDSYDASPPAYEENIRHLPLHSSDADFPPMEPYDMPLNTYENTTCAEPLLTAAAEEEEDCIPSAPSLDQMEANNTTSESLDTKTPTKQKRKITLVRIFLACCVWFAGITFMSVSLYGYECFDKCESENCDHCFGGIRKGGLSLLYTIFILACVLATWKAVRFTLSI